jgi:D-glycero-D-manno-heptose 1,7-bisphosphate phosphatase
MLGDSLRDLVAGQKAGCRAALVMTGKGQKTLADGEGLKDVLVVANLADFTNRLLDGELNHAPSEGEPGKSLRSCNGCEAAAESYL